MSFKSRFRRFKLHLYLNIILGIGCFIFLLNAFIYRRSFLWLFGVLFVVSLIALIISETNRRKNALGLLENVDEQLIPFIRLFDRYNRRLINWSLVAFGWVFSFGFSLISIGINSKPFEFLEKININLIVFEVIAFFIIKNYTLVGWFSKNHNFENAGALRKLHKRAIILSLIYWLVASGIYYYFEEVFVIDSAPFFSGLYIFMALVFNLFKLNQFTHSKKKYNRLVVAMILIVAIVVGGYSFLSRDIWLTQPYINHVPNIYDGHSEITYDERTGVYTITKESGDFKILQLTDIHLGGSFLSYDKDLKALDTIFQLLEETRPDLVIVTGDLVFPIGYASFSFNNTAPVQQFAAFMRNTGIPWAFTYGNHDTESYAASSKKDLNELYKSLSWYTSKNLLYPYVQPDITGRNNQLIELKNQDGSLAQALFLIDSNAYTGEGISSEYDYIHDDQVEWYKNQVLALEDEEGDIVPSMIFIHIPLQEYATAADLYNAGSDEVTYYFGSNKESKVGKVSCSKYPSKLFDTAKELKSTEAIFCGHDHYNNMSLEYQGIRLTYGMSIDYLAMSGIARDTEQRGATLITIHDDGEWDIEQVPFGNKSFTFFDDFKRMGQRK